MAIQHKLHQANRHSWNEATKAHNSHKPDQAAFIAAGGSTLFPEELEMLGKIEGKTIAHLLCNSGQDSLCLARLGAEVTGVDSSDEAIATARRLSAETKIAARFACEDVYAWLHKAAGEGQRFDIAFMSYGAIVWLSDIDAWAQGIRQILNPGGMVAVIDFHPAALMSDDDWQIKYPYFGDGSAVVNEDGVPDYVADETAMLATGDYATGVTEFINPHPEYSFSWSLGQVATALLHAGLQITQLTEYPYSNGAGMGKGMKVAPGRRLYPPDSIGDLPMMFSIAARLS